MTKAYTAAKTRGIYTDISYPSMPGRRQVWQKNSLWRDETPERVYGFDGKREWVWRRGMKWAIAWKPGRKKLYWARHPGLGYPSSYLLRMQNSEGRYAGPLKVLSSDKELIWQVGMSPISPPSMQLRLNSKSLLPYEEKSWLMHGRTVNIDNYRFSLGATVEDGSNEPGTSEVPAQPSFFTFPHTVPTSPKQRARGKGRPMIETLNHRTAISSGSSTGPSAISDADTAKAKLAYTARVTYGTPQAGSFSPTPGMNVLDLEQLEQQWLIRLRHSPLAILETVHYKAVIRHASRDSQGNVYLIYTGSEITPEVFRKRIKARVTFPGYDTLQRTQRNSSVDWISGLPATLPLTMDGEQIRQIVLVPLPGINVSPTAFTLLWTESQGDQEPKAKQITIPLAQEPDGPMCLTALSGPPTKQPAPNQHTDHDIECRQPRSRLAARHKDSGCVRIHCAKHLAWYSTTRGPDSAWLPGALSYPQRQSATACHTCSGALPEADRQQESRG
ncbi:MAG: hypothetical protein QM758_26925 [Armatimonas sp.]